VNRKQRADSTFHACASKIPWGPSTLLTTRYPYSYLSARTGPRRTIPAPFELPCPHAALNAASLTERIDCGLVKRFLALLDET
jgi:hypothetical protein